VILAEATPELDLANIRFESGLDVVITFDAAARAVNIPPSIGWEEMPPIVLSLIVNYTLEHINLQLGSDLEGLERKNALNLVTAAVKGLLSAPEDNQPDPHVAAEMFANFLRSPDDGITWEHYVLPEKVFNLWLSSQPESDELQSDGLLQVGSSNGSRSRKRPSVSPVLY
jgi:hypothetical protein